MHLSPLPVFILLYIQSVQSVCTIMLPLFTLHVGVLKFHSASLLHCLFDFDLYYAAQSMLKFHVCINSGIFSIVYTEWARHKEFSSKCLTCDKGKGANAGEGGDVQVHPLQIGGEFNNAVNPLPKSPQALEPVPHWPIAEDQLPFFRVGPETVWQ